MMEPVCGRELITESQAAGSQTQGEFTGFFDRSKFTKAHHFNFGRNLSNTKPQTANVQLAVASDIEYCYYLHAMYILYMVLSTAAVL